MIAAATDPRIATGRTLHARAGIGAAIANLRHRQTERIYMSDSISAEQLRLLVERRERLEEEKKGIGDDIKDVNAEVKSVGFDLKAFNKIIALRKMEKHARDEQDALVELYRSVLGIS